MSQEWRWLRIPLFDDLEVELAWPEHPVSAANWRQFIGSLEAMRPALVEDDDPDDGGAS